MTHTTALKLVVFGTLGLRMLRADAFLDVNGVYTTIAVPGAQPGTTVASGINDLGQIAGWFVNGSGATEGFVDTNGVFTTFGPPPPLIDSYSSLSYPPSYIYYPVAGINDAGQVVGNFFESTIPAGPYAYLYANGVYTVQDALDAGGINDSGEIITVGFNGSSIFPYTNLVYPGLPAQDTVALGINNAGEVVGEAGSGSFFYFLWVNGTFTQINLPGTPSGINDSGQIIGNLGLACLLSGGCTGDVGAFLDTNGIIQTIAVPGSTSTVAYGINDAGAIVGTFTPGFTPVPEPASLLSAAAGLIGIALLKRYRAARRS